MAKTVKTKRVFDRKVSFDERSRQFPIRTLVADKPLRSYTWRCTQWLNQGQEGACVGFGWSHYLIARPKEEPNITEVFARNLYNQAKTLDEWTGEDYDGTSVIAGAKAVLADKYIKEYRWAFGVDEALLAVSHAAPVILGINWYSGMDNPDKNGLVTATGRVRGGHCIVMTGINVKQKLVRLHNSWGRDWGKDGDCFLSFDDLDKLLQEQGEACIPMTKILVK